MYLDLLFQLGGLVMMRGALGLSESLLRVIVDDVNENHQLGQSLNPSIPLDFSGLW